MTAKNLHINIGLLTRNTLVISTLYPPLFCDRLKIQTNSQESGIATPALLLSAPAYSGRDFCVNPSITKTHCYD